MTVTREEFQRLCRFAASLVRPVNDLQPYALLYAIGGVESSFGKDNRPRHEAKFDRGGRYADATALEQWGSWAACSLGVWQIMFPNAAAVSPGVSPHQIQLEPRVAAVVSALFLDRELKRHKPPDIIGVLDMWNTGNPHDRILPADWYVERGRRYYEEAAHHAQD